MEWALIFVICLYASYHVHEQRKQTYELRLIRKLLEDQIHPPEY